MQIYKCSILLDHFPRIFKFVLIFVFVSFNNFQLQAVKEFAKTHVSFPIGSGQTLNLPVNQEFDLPGQMDDEAMKQLEDFTEALKSSILQMKLAKEKPSSD